MTDTRWSKGLLKCFLTDASVRKDISNYSTDTTSPHLVKDSQFISFDRRPGIQSVKSSHFRKLTDA